MDSWVEYTDPDSGRLYYCHRVTGATQWEKPNDKSDNAPSIDSAEEKLSEELRGLSHGSRLSAADPPTGPPPVKTKERNSNESTNANANTNSNTSASTSSPTTTTQPILPRMSTWLAYYDEGSQRYYYQHKTNGTVTWERPADLDSPVVRQPPPLPAVSPPQRAVPSPIPRPSPSSAHGHSRSYSAVAFPSDPKSEAGQVPLAAGWVEFFDPARGKTYYFHEKTSRTTWNRGEAIVPVRGLPLAARGQLPVKKEDTLADGSSITSTTDMAIDSSSHANMSPRGENGQSRGLGHRPSKSVDVRVHSSKQDPNSDSSTQNQSPQTPSQNLSAGSLSCTQLPSSASTDRRFSDIFTGSPFSLSKPKQSGRTRGNTVADASSDHGSSKEHRHRTMSYFTSLFGTSPSTKPNTASLFQDISKFQETEFAKKHFANCKRGLFKRKIPMKHFLVWSKDVLDHPLIPNTKGIDKYAHKISKDILMFMGDHKSSRPDHHGQEIIMLGRKVAEARDEIILQLCKQITDNPNKQSAMKGWGLLGLCLFSFTPTMDLESHLSTIFDIFEKQKDEATVQFARYCRARIGRLNNRDPRQVTMDEIRTCQDAIYTANPYNCTIDELVSLQSSGPVSGESNSVPGFLVEIIECIKSSGGMKTEGIFRIATDADELETTKSNLIAHKTKLQDIKDPYLLADLMKHFLRDLVVPIVPPKNYDMCVGARNNREKCQIAFDGLPSSHQTTLRYILRFIKDLAHESNQKHTKMDTRSVSLVLAPNILRCPSQDPMVVYAKSQDETDFIHTLALTVT